MTIDDLKAWLNKFEVVIYEIRFQFIMFRDKINRMHACMN